MKYKIITISFINILLLFTSQLYAIASAPVTLTAIGGSSTYGESPVNPGFTATGLLDGETESEALPRFYNNFSINATTPPGTYTLSVDGVLQGYKYFIFERVSATWTVNPKSITVTANGGSSAYGESPANPGFTATGLANGETESVLTGLSNSFGIDATTSPGTYTLSVDGILTNSNYTIATSTSATWTVNPKSITVTANGGSSAYGESPANPGFTATGLASGETESVLTGLSYSFGIDATTPPGTYTLSVDGILTNSNYTIATNTSGTWTVNQKSITVTANGGSSTYGESPTNPGFIATGLANGETESVLPGLSNSFGIDATTPPGTYTLSVEGAFDNSNYEIIARNTGTWIVNPTTTVLNTHPQGASICQGGSHTFSAKAKGTYLQYQWYKGNTPIHGATDSLYTITNATAADYDQYYVLVQGADGQTLSSDTAMLSLAEPLPAELEFMQIPSVIYPHESHRVIVGRVLGFYSHVSRYDWSFSNDKVTFSPEPVSSPNAWLQAGAIPESGVLTVKLTHMCGEERTLSQSIEFRYPTGMDNLNTQGVKVFPNPVMEELKVESGERRVEHVTVTDLNGKTIYQLMNSAVNSVKIVTGHWEKGLYLVKVVTETGTEVVKVIKK